MPETIASPDGVSGRAGLLEREGGGRSGAVSLRDLGVAVRRDLRVFLAIVGTLLATCLIYCLVAPREYEATARVALRGAPVSALALDRSESTQSSFFAPGQIQLETLANVFRSEQLAWRVITELKLYQLPGASPSFIRKFPSFSPKQPDPDAEACLLDEFQKDLTVQTIPRTLVLQLRFRSRSAPLAAAVVNGLIDAYQKQETEERVQATRASAG